MNQTEHKPEEFLSPSDDNPWMMELAEKWMAENSGETAGSDVAINIFAATEDDPASAFAVIQTILKATEHQDELFGRASMGDLESFLDRCSDDFIEVVWATARIDARLRKALRYVWQNQMSDTRYLTLRSLAEM